MTTSEQRRARARETWAAGDWESMSQLIVPVGELVIQRSGIAPGMRVLDVGTGSGGNIAIPAARRGASVVGLDPTRELLANGRLHAAEAGVCVEWIEGEAEQLPFDDGSFDLVISTFGAMFASDHRQAASELVRVSAPTGHVLMTTWCTDGFACALFDLTGAFMPSPPPGEQPPSLWGIERHVRDMFASAGAEASLQRETVVFTFPSVGHAVQHYARDFGPFVVARAVLEPQGRWHHFLDAFGELVGRFNRAANGSAEIASDYFVISARR